jgi:hypothetical protein
MLIGIASRFDMALLTGTRGVSDDEMPRPRLGIGLKSLSTAFASCSPAAVVAVLLLVALLFIGGGIDVVKDSSVVA